MPIPFWETVLLLYPSPSSQGRGWKEGPNPEQKLVLVSVHVLAAQTHRSHGPTQVQSAHYIRGLLTGVLGVILQYVLSYNYYKYTNLSVCYTCIK